MIERYRLAGCHTVTVNRIGPQFADPDLIGSEKIGRLFDMAGHLNRIIGTGRFLGSRQTVHNLAQRKLHIDQGARQRVLGHELMLFPGKLGPQSFLGARLKPFSRSSTR